MTARILACSPTYTGQVCVPFLQSYIASAFHLAVNGVQMELMVANHFTLVQFARNYLMAKFLEDGTYTHLLWLDSDLGWDPTAILRMLGRNKEVIGGVYPLKTKAPTYPYVYDDGPVTDGVQRAERIPTGFMMCTLGAIQRVADSVPKIQMEYQGQKVIAPNAFDLVQEGREYWGEDFVFCKRLRNLGIDIWVEMDIDFQHIGLTAFTGNLARHMGGHPATEPYLQAAPRSVA
jgi:hypothetical protein